MREGKVDSTHDFTARGLGELRAWLEPWFREQSKFGTPAGIPYGTSLPPNPRTGQGAILVDNIYDPSWQWEFRYNASSGSSYKWEFVGGTPASATAGMGAAEFYASSYWGNLATDGPAFTVPRSGEYLVSAQASTFFDAYATGAAVDVRFGPAIGNSDPTSPYFAQLTMIANPGFGQSGDISWAWHPMVLAAGQVVKMRYSCITYGPASGVWYGNRKMVVQPMSVA